MGTSVNVQGWQFEPEGLNHAESAKELSARVLRELRNSVQQYGDLPEANAALITIPAVFQQPQRDDTLEAASLAGFAHAEIVSEPEAAALAFGRNQPTTNHPIWLVYDLGGGTFDTALVRGEDGVFTIMDHHGDRHLGGSNLDEAIMRELVIPRIPSSAQDQFEHGTGKWWSLKGLVETAKCTLSVSDSAWIEMEDSFDGIESIRIDRASVERLQVKVFGETLDHCLHLIERNNLTPDKIDRVVMVGGPTQSQFLREMVERGVTLKGEKPVKGLGIRIDSSVSPITAVAEGAAIFAASRQIPESARPAKVASTSTAKRSLQVTAPNVVHTDDVLIAARLMGEDSPDSLQFRFRRVDSQGGDWMSPKLEPVPASGKFKARVPLNKGRNVFLIELFDAKGSQLQVDDAECEIVNDVAIAQSKLDSGLGVADFLGNTVWLFKKGEPVPDGAETRSEVRDDLKTTVRLERGKSGTALVLPIVEGIHERAALNRVVRVLTVTGDHVPTTIPEGSVVVFEAKLDTNRRFKDLTAYLEDYDLQFTVNREKALSVDESDVHRAFTELKRNLERCRTVMPFEDEIRRTVQEIDDSGKLEEIERQLGEGSESNNKPWDAATDGILAVTRMIDPFLDTVDSLLAWLEQRDRCDGNLSKARSIIRDERHRLSSGWLQEWDDLERDYERANEQQDSDAIVDLAFGRMPQHFSDNPTLASYVNSAAVEAESGDRTTRRAVVGTVKT